MSENVSVEKLKDQMEDAKEHLSISTEQMLRGSHTLSEADAPLTRVDGTLIGLAPLIMAGTRNLSEIADDMSVARDDLRNRQGDAGLIEELGKNAGGQFRSAEQQDNNAAGIVLAATDRELRTLAGIEGGRTALTTCLQDAQLLESHGRLRKEQLAGFEERALDMANRLGALVSDMQGLAGDIVAAAKGIGENQRVLPHEWSPSDGAQEAQDSLRDEVQAIENIGRNW